MDKTGLDGTFLAACCRFTIPALVIASLFTSGVFSYLGFVQGVSVTRSAVSDSSYRSALPGFSAVSLVAEPESQTNGELLPCQPADAASGPIGADEHLTVAWQAAHKVSSITSRTGYLKLDHLSVDTVVARRSERGFNQLTVYFSNFSCRPGLVQVRPVVQESSVNGSEGECNPASVKWNKRRVPRHSQLAYTVVIPCSGDAFSLAFLVRGYSTDRVLTVQQVERYAGETQLVENKANEYMGLTIGTTEFNALPASDVQRADNI